MLSWFAFPTVTRCRLQYADTFPSVACHFQNLLGHGTLLSWHSLMGSGCWGGSPSALGMCTLTSPLQGTPAEGQRPTCRGRPSTPSLVLLPSVRITPLPSASRTPPHGRFLPHPDFPGLFVSQFHQLIGCGPVHPPLYPVAHVQSRRPTGGRPPWPSSAATPRMDSLKAQVMVNVF